MEGLNDENENNKNVDIIRDRMEAMANSLYEECDAVIIITMQRDMKENTSHVSFQFMGEHFTLQGLSQSLNDLLREDGKF